MCEARKESTQTQTLDLLCEKGTLCKSVETQCDNSITTNLNCESNSPSDLASSTIVEHSAVESSWEKLRDYSYIKVTVFSLDIGSTYQNSSW